MICNKLEKNYQVIIVTSVDINIIEQKHYKDEEVNYHSLNTFKNLHH